MTEAAVATSSFEGATSTANLSGSGRDMVLAAAVWLLYSDITVLALRDYGAPFLIAFVIPLLLGSAALYAIIRTRWIRLDTGMLIICAYVLINLVSGSLSDFPDRAVADIFSLVTEGALIYFLVINAIRTRRTLIFALWAAILAAGLLGGLALTNAVTSNSVVAFGGLAKLGPLDPDVPGGLRTAGPSVGPNYFAQVLMMPLPFAIAFAAMARSLLQRAIAVLAIIGIVAGVVLTYSRGGAIGLVAILVLSLLFIKMNRTVAVLGLAAAFAVMVATNPSYLDRLTSLSEVSDVGSSTASGSFEGRFVENLAAARMFAERPILGVGPANYPGLYNVFSADYPLYRDRAERYPHSLPLQIAAELGLGGLIAFGTLAAWLLWRLAVIARGSYDSHIRMFASAAVIALVGYFVTSLFLHAAFFRFFWMLVALSGALIGLPHEINVAKPRLWRRWRPALAEVMQTQSSN